MERQAFELMKLAILFPGIGYHCDKPLLYYARKLTVKYGYLIREVSYGSLPKNVKGDPEKMAECYRLGLAAAEAQLADVDWDACGEVLLIGKSIGTAIAAGFAAKHVPWARSIWYTPLTETFRLIQGEGIAFHGTKDPWAETPAVQQGCAEKGIPCYLTEDANHSLETGDVQTDLRNLRTVMERTEAYIAGSACR